MLISKVQVLNYKSFRDSGWIEFRSGINIITGQNSAGKTALLEALAPNFQNIPHRSISILPTASSLPKAQSQTNFSLSFTKNERQSIVAQIPLPYFIPAPSAISSDEALQLFQIWLDKPEDEMVSASIFGDSVFLWERFDKKSSFGLYEVNTPLNNIEISPHIQIQRDLAENLVMEGLSNLGLEGNSFTNFLRISQLRIYRFLAERLNVGSCGRTYNHELLPNASNLPEALGILQGKNPELFELFNEYVSIIFPQIKRISILQGAAIEIKVWHISPSTFRDDLSFSLSACGTGVGQVLSILFVILTAQFPRVIIIDEPQSFLHPGAAKKLIEIFKELGKNGRFPEHQYIISTHSPTIIAAAEPATITMLRYTENCETLVSTMNSENARELRTLLDEVGVSLSDVFGMDKILWVEGPTEEKCYPLIIANILKKPLRGVQILAVKNTGDLEGKRAHIIFDVYDKLSGSQNLFPPAVGFLFDKEDRTEQQMKDLRKRSLNPVEFLSRRMYENYLLHPEAIASVLNELDTNQEKVVEPSDVEIILEESKKAHFPKGIADVSLIDGANVLKDIFPKLSNSRVTFLKTRDSLKLTEWLITNRPESLIEISEILGKILYPINA